MSVRHSGFSRTTQACSALAITAVLGACVQDRAPRAADLPQATPLAERGYERTTTHDEMVAFLEATAGASPRVRLHSMGTSVEGRALPYLTVSLGEFGAERNDRTMILIYAQQHGNEPGGKEGVLELGLELARGDHDEILRAVDVILVPQVNPDGAERHERRNADGVDLNRAHLVLDGAEVEALRTLFHRWEPEVAVDVHEYSPWSETWLERGWLRLWDLQIGLPTNLNTDPGIRRLAEEAFLPRAEAALEGQGFTVHNYIVGTPRGVRWSTADINDGRQGLAILHTLSFIYEGRRTLDPHGHLQRRATASRAGLEYLLRFSAEEGERIRRTVREARARARAGEPARFHLATSRAPGDEPLRIPVEQVTRQDQDWMVVDTVMVTIDPFRPRIVSERSTTLPCAYLVPGTRKDILSLLSRHQVKMHAVPVETELPAERMVIEGFESLELESLTPIPVVSRRPEAYSTGEGDALVPTAQLRGLMVATALEPESMHGLIRYPRFQELAREGLFPVLRVRDEAQCPSLSDSSS